MIAIISPFCNLALVFAMASTAVTPENEIKRIQSHLSLVEKLLKQSAPDNISGLQIPFKDAIIKPAPQSR